MNTFEQEQLLGYLLDALDDSERELFQRRLIREPDLRGELASVSEQLRPLQAAVLEFEPPPGLADRTCRFVTVESRGWETFAPRVVSDDLLSDTSNRPCRSPHGAGRGTMSEEPAPPGWISRFRLVDVAATAAILVLAAMLIFPAIGESRFNSRVAACRGKLQDLGVAMTDYSDRHDGFFPRIPGKGKLATAGVYAPLLADAGLLRDSSQLACPGLGAVRHETFRLPTTDQLRAASEEQLVDLRPRTGGDFGYTLGYVEDGRYHNTKNLGRSHFALMSDTPGNVSDSSYSSPSAAGLQSLNHGGRGQNVLFEDGRVTFVSTGRSAAKDGDHFFTNDDGLIAAGTHRDDSVIGSSNTAPIIYVSGQ